MACNGVLTPINKTNISPKTVTTPHSENFNPPPPPSNKQDVKLTHKPLQLISPINIDHEIFI